MFRAKAITLAALMCSLLCAVSAQANGPVQVPSQTPRQAIVEMLSGSDDAFRKHLTVEIQQRLDDLQKSAPGSPSPTQALSAARTSGNSLESFAAGPVLF